MTYKKNFVAAIKVDGKILRETSDRVELPFGSEYSILLKNLDTVRVMARISIDGKDATDWLVIGPGQDIEVERFIEDLDKGNRFKFIELTDTIEKHRGIKAEDGLVRVEFKREKVYEAPKIIHHDIHTYHYPVYPHYPGGCYPWITYTSSSGTPPILRGNISASGSLNRGMTACNISGVSNQSQCNVSYSAQNTSSGGSVTMGWAPEEASVENDKGITVAGSISNQKFRTVSGFETERAEVVVLHLIGSKQGTPVKQAKTVKLKIECETCGKKNKSSVKFCGECGTSLEKV